MELLIILVFVVGYLLITLEHSLHIDKAAPALLLGVLTWAIFSVWTGDHHHVEEELFHHLPEIVNILFFLLGAMTIVELIDIHDGFHVITSRIVTREKVKLLWIVCILTFFMSAALDNLTTAIVMASLLRKLIPQDRAARLLFAGMIIISANAGGAWSPIGDVTTTMLWIGDCISTTTVIGQLIIPSLVCMFVPLMVISRRFKGSFAPLAYKTSYRTTTTERMLVLCAGVACLIFVPVFKTVTHLPPFMGMFFGVGVMWTLTELLHKGKALEEKSSYSVLHALTKIDTPSILFFFGILAGVACLSSIGVMKDLAIWLDANLSNRDVVVVFIGMFSSVVDNVPLVAASMKMYDVVTPEMIAAGATANEVGYFAMNGKFWEFLAYCAGTGGSVLIIGSAAGVAIMGIERIEFFWYMKNFTFLALLGYISGAIVYLLMYPFTHADSPLYDMILLPFFF